MLVVRLEDGRLPKGCYVSKGVPCRYHLQKVIADQKWKVDQSSFKEISPGKHSSRQPRQLSSKTIKDRFLSYKAVVESCLD